MPAAIPPGSSEVPRGGGEAGDRARGPHDEHGLVERLRAGDQAAYEQLVRHAKRLGRTVDRISRETMDRLASYAWPGNIRELENVIERALVLSRGRVLELDRDLLPVPPAVLSTAGAAAPTSNEAASRPLVSAATSSGTPPPPSATGLMTLEELERTHIVSALERVGWMIEGSHGAARILNLHPNTLRSRMKKLGIRRAAHEPI